MRKIRTKESETPWAIRARRFPHILGGSPAMRSLSAKQRVEYLRNTKARRLKGPSDSSPWLRRHPIEAKRSRCAWTCRPKRSEPWTWLDSKSCSPGQDEPARVQAYSGRQKAARTRGRRAEERHGRRFVRLGASIFTRRLCPLRRTGHVGLLQKPRHAFDHAAYVARLRAGRMRRYDWDKGVSLSGDATITNGSKVSRTFRSCAVRVTEAVRTTPSSARSRSTSGPFTVRPAGSPSDGGHLVSQGQRRVGQVQSAMGPDRQVHLCGGQRRDLRQRRLSSDVHGAHQRDLVRRLHRRAVERRHGRGRNGGRDPGGSRRNSLQPRLADSVPRSGQGPYGIIDLDWDNGERDYAEADDLREDISGPDGERVESSSARLHLLERYARRQTERDRLLAGRRTVSERQ